MMEGEFGTSSRAIDSSNVGFKLLKKCGWKEGTGLGISEQGRLEPIQAHVKKSKSGLGAEKTKKTMKRLPEHNSTDQQNENGLRQPKKKTKSFSKRIRKMLDEEEKRKEREFDQAFFREFWPDNV